MSQLPAWRGLVIVGALTALFATGLINHAPPRLFSHEDDQEEQEMTHHVPMSCANCHDELFWDDARLTWTHARGRVPCSLGGKNAKPDYSVLRRGQVLPEGCSR